MQQHMLRRIGQVVFIPLIIAIGATLGVFLQAHIRADRATAFELLSCHNQYVSANFVDVFYEWGTNLQTPGTLWRIAWETAMSDWNAANTQKEVGFFRFPGEPNKIHSVWDETTIDFGWANVACDPNTGHWAQWDVFNNTFSTQTFNANQRRSTSCHELGHVLGLDHTTNGSLMDNGRDRNAIFVPQPDDVNGVNAQYSHVH